MSIARTVLAMVEQRQAGRRGRVLGGVRPTGEDHQATTFELFFDLVYVFAATQVTGYMAHEHSGHGVVQGMLLLALLWWTWSAYAWLGNQARADEGVLRAGMAVAMAAIFVVALTIPEGPGTTRQAVWMGRSCWWAPTWWSAACTSRYTRWPRPATAACGTSSPSPGGRCW
jgi:hypothetical protein